MGCISEQASTAESQVSSTKQSQNGTVSRRPKARQVSSRYLSPCSTSTTTTYSWSSSSSSSAEKRSQSADRRRRVIEPNRGNVSQVSGTLRRSLSVSFQGEAFSLPISKAKTSVSNVRERRRVMPVRGDQVENFRPGDQHRWPARTKEGSLGSNPMSRSLDYVNGIKRLGGFGSDVAAEVLERTMCDESRRVSCDGKLRLNLDDEEVLVRDSHGRDGCFGNESSVTSDSDSVSSGSTTGLPECGVVGSRSVSRSMVVPARFWQETNSRLRRLQDPGSPLSSENVRTAASADVKKFSSDSVRPASPNKLWISAGSSPARGASSPHRVRSYIAGLFSGKSVESPSILSFAVDIRRKVGEDRIADAHMLRLLYNRHLQWRFINARADATRMIQTQDAEENLWNAWATISELQHSVMLKRIKLLLLRQKLHLASILKGQMACLEEWALIEKDHSNSLVGATDALKASTLRLPLFGKAVADIQSLKEAIGSALEVMQTMESSTSSLTSKVEEINALVTGLVSVTVKEQVLLDQCRDSLSELGAVQVSDCSLKAHIIQQHRQPNI